MTRLFRHWLLCLSLLALCLGWSPAASADEASDEYFVKAALVYNFVRFTEWPDEAWDPENTELRIGVYGDDEVVSAMAGLSGRTIGDRHIVVVKVEQPDDLLACQTVFIAKSERSAWSRLLNSLDGSPALVIGEVPGFLDGGGMINLHLVNNRIRFEINQDQATACRIRISSRLLKLASSVVNSKGEKR